MTTPSGAEARTVTRPVELRADNPTGPVAAGYAAVFGRRSSDLGGFTEVISPTAFDRSISQGADVVALWNHHERDLLGRVASGTLRLSVDDVGLRYEVSLPDTDVGRNITELLRRGDVRGSSFAFRTVADSWYEDPDDGAITRTLDEVALIDVSPVTRPAYPDTTAALRSLATHLGREVEAVTAAATNGELRSLFSGLDSTGTGSTESGDDARNPTTVVRPKHSALLA